MAGKKNIASVFKDENKSFLKHLKSASGVEEDNIHKLRVDVKKIRSLLKFFEILPEEKFHKNKIMNLISPVFKSAGKIRTATLNLEMISHYQQDSVSGFKKYLEKKEGLAKKSFLKERKQFNKDKFTELCREVLRGLKKTHQKAIDKRSDEYMKILFSKVRKDLPEISNDEFFHDVRKKLKDIKTISGLLEKTGSNPVDKARQKNTEVIEEKIGKWHDNVVLVSELEIFISEKKPVKNSEELSMLAINLKLDNDTAKKLIAKQMNKKLF